MKKRLLTLDRNLNSIDLIIVMNVLRKGVSFQLMIFLAIIIIPIGVMFSYVNGDIFSGIYVVLLFLFLSGLLIAVTSFLKH